MKQDTSFCVHCYTTSPLRKPQHDVSFPSKQYTSYMLTDCNTLPRGRSDMLIRRIHIFKLQIYLTHSMVKIFVRNKLLSQALQISATHSVDIHRMYPFIFFSFCAKAPSGPGPPHSWCFWITHNDTTQSVELLWTSDQLVAETSTWQNTTLTTDRNPRLRWDSNPQFQQASGRRPTP